MELPERTGHTAEPGFAIRSLRLPDPPAFPLSGSPASVDFYWVKSGTAQLLCGEVSHSLRPADLLILHGAPAELRAVRNLCGYHLCVSAGFLRAFHSDALFAPLRPFLAVLEDPFLRLRFAAGERCEAEWLLSRMEHAEDRGNPEFSSTSLRLLFGHFLLLCHRQWSDGQPDARSISTSGEDVVRILKSYIDEHLAESFGLTQLAQKAGYTPSYLSSLFTKATGQGVTEYICRNRIARAQELLGSTQLKVMQVCYDVGFRDLTHFNRTFKKMVGVTPTQYRHLHASRAVPWEQAAQAGR